MTLGIIGHGNFGAFTEDLVRRFAPDISIKVYSSREQPDGIRFFSFEETAASDYVVLAVPIHSFEDVLVRALPHMLPEGVIVDISTVKLHTIGILDRVAGGRPYIAAHPMFGPESYAARKGDITGFRIVLCKHTIPEVPYLELLSVLRGWGFNVVEMSAEQHDRHLAETLFLTHFIGQMIAHAKFERTEIDTVSFSFLMDAVAAVRHDTELFKDVFRYDPFCNEVLDRFEISEHAVRALLGIDGKTQTVGKERQGAIR